MGKAGEGNRHGAEGEGAGLGSLLVKVNIQHARLLLADAQQRGVQAPDAVLVQCGRPLLEGFANQFVNGLNHLLVGMDTLLSRPNMGQEVGTGKALGEGEGREENR